MEKGRIHRRASHAHHHKSCACHGLAQRQHQKSNAPDGHRLPQTNHVPVIKLHGDKPADKPSHGDPQIKQRRPLCRRAGRKPSVQHHVTGRPKPCRQLQSAVAEKRHHGFLCSRKLKNLPKADIPSCPLLPPFRRFAAFPERQRGKQRCRQPHLQQGNNPISPGPGQSSHQARAHDIRSNRRPHTPKTVKPAHMPCLIVKGYIIVQRRVHRPGSQAVGQRDDTQHPKRIRHRKSPQSPGSHRHADGRYLSRPQPFRQRVAEQAGNDRAS